MRTMVKIADFQQRMTYVSTGTQVGVGQRRNEAENVQQRRSELETLGGPHVPS